MTHYSAKTRGTPLEAFFGRKRPLVWRSFVRCVDQVEACQLQICACDRLRRSRSSCRSAAISAAHVPSLAFGVGEKALTPRSTLTLRLTRLSRELRFRPAVLHLDIGGLCSDNSLPPRVEFEFERLVSLQVRLCSEPSSFFRGSMSHRDRGGAFHVGLDPLNGACADAKLRCNLHDAHALRQQLARLALFRRR